MNTSFEHSSRTALVLGGAGSAGNAWLIGVMAGLYEAGVDVTDADLTIGTSAGATAAAQIAGAAPADLYAAILAADAQPLSGAPGSGRRRIPSARLTNQDHVETLTAAIAAAEDMADLRRRLGAAALAADSGWRATVASRLPGELWPQRRMFIPAVDAHTGEPVVFDRHSGVDLVDAVAASSSGTSAYSIGDRRYIGGGFRSNAENADLAAGYSRVLVLSPFGGRSLYPPEWRTDLATQIDELRLHGSNVEMISPEGNVGDIFAVGGNVMAPSTRGPAARGGYEQGRALAGKLTGFWR